MRAEVFLQALISFIIVAFGQPSFGPWIGPIAAMAGYAFFWRAIRIYPFKLQRFWRGALWYGSITLVQLSWMTSIEFQGAYILLVWIALSLWMAVQFGFLTLLIPYNRHLSFPRILAIASTWVFLEWSRYYVLCGYSWNPSGLALSNTQAVQMASIFGILGLSFWVIFVNLVGLRALLRKRIPHYVVWIAVASLPYLYGTFHLSYHDKQILKQKNLQTVSCALVQTGLLPPEKIPIQGKIRSFISPYRQWERMLTFLHQQSSRSPDLILFPEAAVPFPSSAMIYEQGEVELIFSKVFGPIPKNVYPKNIYPYGEKGTRKVSNVFWAQTIANLLKSEVVIGFDHELPDGISHNSAFHACPDSVEVGRYDKQILMPLAEYLPFIWLGPLVKIYGITDFFAPGKGAKLFQGKVPFAASICYEETFPQKVREGRLLGAQLLANVTNDGWYPSSSLPSQHFELARLRAVENGCPLIRACNTGVTAAIDGCGRVIGKIEERDVGKNLQSGILFTDVLIYDYSTLYTYWGNWGILALSLIFILIFVSLKKTFRW